MYFALPTRALRGRLTAELCCLGWVADPGGLSEAGWIGSAGSGADFRRRWRAFWLLRLGSSGLERPDPGHVLGERVPEGDGLDLAGAADEQSDEAAIAELGVAAFGSGRAQLIDLLGLLGAHASAPDSDLRRIGKQRHEGVAPPVTGLGRRRVDRAAGLPQDLDVVELGETASGQMLGRPGAVIGDQLLAHRQELA